MSVTVEVEAGEHFGHQHLILRARGQPTRVVSLSDPAGREALARALTEMAAGWADEPDEETAE